MASIIDDLLNFVGLNLSGQLTFVDLFNSFVKAGIAVAVIALAFSMISYMVKEINRGLR